MTDSKKRTIIDFHQHPDWWGHNLDRALSNMDKYGIDQAVLLSWESPKEDFSPVYLPALPSCFGY